MNKLIRWTLPLLLLLALPACDSTEAEENNPFVGTWTVTQVMVNDQDLTVALFAVAEVNSVTATFDAEGDFVMAVTRADGRTETVGDYQYNAAADLLTLSATTFAAPVPMTYAATSATLTLSSDSPALLIALVDSEDLELLQSQVGEIRSVSILMQRSA